ncbi:MAG: hypothetical protein L6R41_005266 [Letrouitia leprolyta]|nr:MAG: hypothetical protein L6R41_005266 [Letrouitia leprolyta]
MGLENSSTRTHPIVEQSNDRDCYDGESILRQFNNQKSVYAKSSASFAMSSSAQATPFGVKAEICVTYKPVVVKPASRPPRRAFQRSTPPRLPSTGPLLPREKMDKCSTRIAENPASKVKEHRSKTKRVSTPVIRGDSPEKQKFTAVIALLFSKPSIVLGLDEDLQRTFLRNLGNLISTQQRRSGGSCSSKVSKTASRGTRLKSRGSLETPTVREARSLERIVSQDTESKAKARMEKLVNLVLEESEEEEQQDDLLPARRAAHKGTNK